MRVLGVDPGLTRLGLGVVDSLPSRGVRMVAVGVLRTPKEAAVDVRLGEIAEHFDRWLDEYRPDAVSVERVFARTDVSTIMGTAQASGLAIGLAARRGIPVAMHTPSEVKAAITGSGRANKAQMTAMVTRILKLDEAPKPADAADALAIAICHLWRGAASGLSTPGASDVSERLDRGRATSGLTAAQRQWAEALKKAR